MLASVLSVCLVFFVSTALSELLDPQKGEDIVACEYGRPNTMLISSAVALEEPKKPSTWNWNVAQTAGQRRKSVSCFSLHFVFPLPSHPPSLASISRSSWTASPPPPPPDSILLYIHDSHGSIKRSSKLIQKEQQCQPSTATNNDQWHTKLSRSGNIRLARNTAAHRYR